MKKKMKKKWQNFDMKQPPNDHKSNFLALTY